MSAINHSAELKPRMPTPWKRFSPSCKREGRSPQPAFAAGEPRSSRLTHRALLRAQQGCDPVTTDGEFTLKRPQSRPRTSWVSQQTLPHFTSRREEEGDECADTNGPFRVDQLPRGSE